MRVWRDVRFTLFFLFLSSSLQPSTWWVGVVCFWRGNARLGTLTYVGVLSLPPPLATVAAEKQAFPRYCHGSLTVYVCGCVGRKWLNGNCMHVELTRGITSLPLYSICKEALFHRPIVHHTFHRLSFQLILAFSASIFLFKPDPHVDCYQHRAAW